MPGEKCRCVVWVPPEGAAPTRLLAALSQRRLPAAVVLDAPSVMQQLAEAGGGVVTLIVVEPASQPHLDELLQAVQTYYESAAVWQYRARGDGLTSLKGPAEPRRSHDSVDTASGGGMSQADSDVAARTNGATHNRTDEPLDPDRLDESTRALITPEELDMLLGPLESESQELPRA